MDFCIYDPFLDASHPLSPQFSTLEKVMQQDVVSIHTPLTTDGAFPTYHMLDRPLLAGMKQNAILINAARGEVLDNRMLADLLTTRNDLQVALDVWEHEPQLHEALLHKAAIATPHIAGYSTNGKRNGTAWVCRQFCDYFGLEYRPPSEADKPLTLAFAEQGEPAAILNGIILQAYPIDRDSRPEELIYRFDELRNGYVFREEFPAFTLDTRKLPAALIEPLRVLGFRLR